MMYKPVQRTTAYRYPNELLNLLLTLGLILGVIILSAFVTVCTSAVFAAGMVLISYFMNSSHHQALMEHALPVNQERMPGLAAISNTVAQRLQPGRVVVYVAPGKQMNAYTFGISDPKVVVLYSSLLETMDDGEIAFIVGHEMGHVSLGHTWLNTLVGGMAGIPAPYGAAALLAMAFMGWNRACELSADRAGLLACGSLRQATSALIKLAAGPHADAQATARALERIDAEDDDSMSGFREALSTHPMLIRRINELRQYAATGEYQRLLTLVSANVV